MLLVFALAVFSAGFHEFGHAAATRYGGGTPGGMGMGIYMVWPAFYTDVTDAYRLPRRDRLRVDLGGLYFNAVVAVATLAVWLDYPLRVRMWRSVRRTVVRSVRRVELWNGNHEPPLRTFFTDPDHIVRWAWKTRRKTAARVGELLDRRPELPVVRLRSHAAAERWLRGPLREAG